MGDVEVALRMETQGSGHCDQLVQGLIEAGYRILERH